MVIDNDSHVRNSLRVFFQDSSILFLIFKSGVEGLNSLKYQDIDVVISDYFLPDMDGIEFLNQVAKTHPKAFRILMATIVSDDLKLEIIRCGIDCFIEKPLRVATLDTIINQLEIAQKDKGAGR